MHILKDVKVQRRKQHREEDTMMNEVNYILSAAEQINEVTSIEHTPRAANGIITPRIYMTLQVTNLTNKKKNNSSHKLTAC